MTGPVPSAEVETGAPKSEGPLVSGGGVSTATDRKLFRVFMRSYDAMSKIMSSSILSMIGRLR